jgi:hypothetical protein
VRWGDLLDLGNALKRRSERGRGRKGDQYHLLVMAKVRDSRQYSSSVLLAYAARDDEG